MLNVTSGNMPASPTASGDAWPCGDMRHIVSPVRTAFPTAPGQAAGLADQFNMSGSATIIYGHPAPAIAVAAPQPSPARNLADRVAETFNRNAAASCRTAAAENREEF